MSSGMMFKFPDSGREISVRKVSPFLAMEAQKGLEIPQPPLQKVDYGDGVIKEERNPAHPDYQKSLVEYNQEVERRTFLLIVKRGIIHTLSDEETAEVKEIRKFMKDEFSSGIALDDLTVFIKFICITSQKDLEALIAAVLAQGQPTPEGVARATSFPGSNV